MQQVTYLNPEVLTKSETESFKILNKNVQYKLLVVDDEPDTIFLLKNILEREGYEVYSANNGVEAIEKLNLINPSLILTDMMMPQMDGWQTIKKIQETADIPIIVLSVLNQTDSIVRALEMGADDYITKPFNQIEVIARIESVLRRVADSNRITRIGIEKLGLILDLDTREAFFQGHCFQLTGKMFDVLKMLMNNSPRLVTYEELARSVWGDDTPAVRNRLKYLVYLLRQQFLEGGASADFIENIGRLGYKISTYS